MENRKSSDLRILRILFILICLTFISVWMMAHVYARYTTQASGEDSARVAKFRIKDSSTLTGDYAVTLVPGTSETFDVEIINDSEVSVNYIFQFEVYGNLPLNIEMKDASDLNAGNTDTNSSQNNYSPIQKSDDGSWKVEKKAGANVTDTYQAQLSLAGGEYQNSAGVAMIAMTVKVEQID